MGDEEGRRGRGWRHHCGGFDSWCRCFLGGRRGLCEGHTHSDQQRGDGWPDFDVPGCLCLCFSCFPWWWCWQQQRRVPDGRGRRQGKRRKRRRRRRRKVRRVAPCCWRGKGRGRRVAPRSRVVVSWQRSCLALRAVPSRPAPRRPAVFCVVVGWGGRGGREGSELHSSKPPCLPCSMPLFSLFLFVHAAAHPGKGQ